MKKIFDKLSSWWLKSKSLSELARDQGGKPFNSVKFIKQVRKNFTDAEIESLFKAIEGRRKKEKRHGD